MRLRRITARRSSVHGKWLFALQPIAAGERLIEYKGEVTSWRRAAARQRSAAGHTFVFGLSSGRVIDGSRSGNSAPRPLHVAPDFGLRYLAAAVLARNCQHLSPFFAAFVFASVAGAGGLVPALSTRILLRSFTFAIHPGARPRPEQVAPLLGSRNLAADFSVFTAALTLRAALLASNMCVHVCGRQAMFCHQVANGFEH